MKYKNKIKILLVAPCSYLLQNAISTGGISTWTKTVFDYYHNNAIPDIELLNTVNKFTLLPKRWSVRNKITHLLVGIIDSLWILICLIIKMLVLRPQIVHYTSSAAYALYKDIVTIWIVKKIFHKKIIIHWHFGRIPEIFEEKNNEYALLKKVCNKVDLSIVIDQLSYKTLKKEQINVVYIPNPISSELQQEAEQQKINKDKGERHIGEVLFVGQVLPTKGIYELVQACANSSKVQQLTIVGPFFDEQIKIELLKKALLRDNGKWMRIEGEKKREEIWDYYKNCSIFCLPSYTEGFPNVILEAMAFACPIVATSVGAIPEMLSEGCGVLVEPRQKEVLRDCIDNILSNPAEAQLLGIKANEKVLNSYTIDKVYNQYYQVWNSL